MNKVYRETDRQYLSLMRDIIENGEEKSTRAGETLSVFGRSMRFDLSKEFPLITTKKVFTKGILHELLWFISGSTNIKYLVDNNVHIWDDDAYRYYLEICNSEPISKEEFIESVKLERKFFFKTKFDGVYKHYIAGNLGKVYGRQWRSSGKLCVDQLQKVIDALKSNPNDRRIIVDSWNVDDLNEMALPPCHFMMQFYTSKMKIGERLDMLKDRFNVIVDSDLIDSEIDNILEHYNIPKLKLSCLFYMRSNDFCCGNPFNICQYAMLTHIIANICDMGVGELIFNGGDIHIYKNHIEQAMEQLSRNGTDSNPRFVIKRKLTSLDNLSYDDFEIVGYEAQPSIKYKLNVGL